VKRPKEQVKANLGRFPSDFMFTLSELEVTELVANCDRLSSLKNYSFLLMAFTEQGVLTLASGDAKYIAFKSRRLERADIFFAAGGRKKKLNSHSQLTTHYSPLTTHYSLLTTHYSLLTTNSSQQAPHPSPAKSLATICKTRAAIPMHSVQIIPNDFLPEDRGAWH